MKYYTHYTGCPRKNETHFQFLITLKLFNPYKSLYTIFRYIIYPHLCKITAQLLLYILRYCIKTEDSLFLFFPKKWDIHTFTLLIICYFGITNTFVFCQVFPSKTANPFVFFHLFFLLFIYIIYLFIYLFI